MYKSKILEDTIKGDDLLTCRGVFPTASLIWRNSVEVTPPITKTISVGWSFGRGLLTFINKLKNNKYKKIWLDLY